MVNIISNTLPCELHVPAYEYCNPCTKLAKRLERGHPVINPLDAACKAHDVAYSKNRKNVKVRNAAETLADKESQRLFPKDSVLGKKSSCIMHNLRHE